MNSQEIRQKFLDFFTEKGHSVVSSAPIVIKNDPTLMFTNAGMNQFKDLFLGISEVKNSRVVNSQKCLRVSGKHNDLDEVGHDTYHHTMFEMLGNWSFGDYFKKEAIDWAWELLTDVYGIDKDRLYVTVFEGAKEDQLEMDQEAFNCWKSHVPEDRILNGNKKDNFWEMGDVGPCGPCSEIHIDLRPDEERSKVDARTLVNYDHPQVVEVWNLVFMQYNRRSNGSLENLPNTHVDTGMGFERLAMALQEKQSNYDTDVFTPIIQKLTSITGFEYGKDEKVDIALRVVSDHVRAIAFAIADGQLPSNNGAGYVIRRILRRAVRYGFTFLDVKGPFMFQLVAVLVDQMGEFFPEIQKQQTLVEKVIHEEENSFMRTLEKGLKRIDEMIGSSGRSVIEGVKAFELYDTFGFPIDLTALILSENGKEVDMDGFHAEMQKQKDRARAASAIETDDWVTLFDAETTFLGYDQLVADVKISQYRKVKQKGKTFYQLVFDQTPFYAEGGGQVGDKGIISSNGKQISIFNTKKENNLIVHFTNELPADPSDVFVAHVDKQKRASTEKNHSATHLLHEALRSVLGVHVEQKGSLVNDQYLRFDFSHFSKMTSDEIQQVEDHVNLKIRENIALTEKRSIPMTEAQQLGAMMLFGEKYGDAVRVIQFGSSIELCGGCHVGSTGQIGLIKITSEGGVAAGVRRIEAISSEKAFQYFKQQEETLNKVCLLLKNANDPIKGIESLLKENAHLEKKLNSLLAQKVTGLKSDLIQSAQEINGVNFISAIVDLEPEAMKDLSFACKSEVDNLLMVLGAENNGKASLSVAVSEGLTQQKGLNAGQIIREIAKEINGGGGGQAFFATAGGKSPEGLQNALTKTRDLLK
ncbi:alanine--tRNA ligase [Flavobacteriales bacterium]|nr:alanine--tRNA ligase [Flavobacteriales bacterium]